MSKKEKEFDVNDATDLYDRIQNEIDNEQVDEIMHAFSYSLAQIVADLEIPKKAFLAHFVELFDSACKYINKPNSSGEH